jgi:hypothetical protein
MSHRYYVFGVFSLLAIVTLSGTGCVAITAGPDMGIFTIYRTGSTGAALVVNYTMSGTATSGSDYSALAGSVTIANGSSTATVTVTPIDDSVSEGTNPESVIVTITSSTAYFAGSPSSATVSIAAYAAS